jgi:hypothetical protein
VSTDAEFWNRDRSTAVMALVHEAVAKHAQDDTLAHTRLRVLERTLGAAGGPLTGDSTAWRRGLDSPWLRRLALRIVNATLGPLSADPNAADTLARMRRALRIDRADLPVEEDAAALLGGLGRPSVDWLRWDDEAEPGFVWRLPTESLPIAPDARVDVSLGQTLVLLRQGRPLLVVDRQVTGVPLSTLLESPTPDLSPPLELAFVSTRSSNLVRWGMDSDMFVPTTRPDTQGVEQPIRGFGRFSVAVLDLAAFLARFARQGLPEAHELEQRLGRIVAGRFAEALRAEVGPEGLDPERMVGELPLWGDRVRPALDLHLKSAGLRLARFELENVTAPRSQALTSRSPAPRTSAQPDALVSCSRCLSPVPAKAKFCATCGTRQFHPCPHCAADVPLRAKFCAACGRGVTPPAT